MAKPRVFISSTFFDLRIVRADLERFIKEMGYEPVLFERGQIPYDKEEALEDSCYREVATCDIIVAIIGGKYGSISSDQKHSITHKEMKTAIEQGKQIYVFVERNVLGELETYKRNKDVKGFTPASVNDVKVFHLIEEIYALPRGNPVESFELSGEITSYLKEQWAGLFQRMLQESSRRQEINIIENINHTAETLNKLVTYLKDEKTRDANAIQSILLSMHPAFNAIQKADSITYRVFFQNKKELNSLLKARGYEEDDVIFSDDNNYAWLNNKRKRLIFISRSIFDSNGKLKIFTDQDWQESWVTTSDFKPSYDDEIPF